MEARQRDRVGANEEDDDHQTQTDFLLQSIDEQGVHMQTKTTTMMSMGQCETRHPKAWLVVVHWQQNKTSFVK